MGGKETYQGNEGLQALAGADKLWTSITCIYYALYFSLNKIFLHFKQNKAVLFSSITHRTN